MKRVNALEPRLVQEIRDQALEDAIEVAAGYACPCQDSRCYCDQGLAIAEKIRALKGKP